VFAAHAADGQRGVTAALTFVFRKRLSFNGIEPTFNDVFDVTHDVYSGPISLDYCVVTYVRRRRGQKSEKRKKQVGEKEIIHNNPRKIEPKCN